MSSEQLGSGVNILKGDLAASFDILSGSAASYQDLGIARRFGGAAAAYSLRDVGAMNGRVVKVRREQDTTPVDFSAGAIASGGIEQFAIGQSVLDKYNNAAYFPAGNADYFSTSNIDLTGAFTITTSFIFTGDETMNELTLFFGNAGKDVINFTNYGQFRFRRDTDNKYINLDTDIKKNTLHTLVVTRDSSDVVSISIDGVTQSNTVTEAGTYQINRLGFRNRGTIFDININGVAAYTGDGADASNWTDTIGSNDATKVGTPEVFTGQGISAFVDTWYDQSGSGNNAVQATTTKQPKIISDGSIVSNANGFASIKFESANSTELDIGRLISNLNSVSAYAVTQKDDTDSNVAAGLNQGSSADSSRFFLPFYTSSTAPKFGYHNNAAKISFGTVSTGTCNMYSVFSGDTNIEAFLNGSSVGTTTLADQAVTSSASKLGQIANTFRFDGVMSEIYLTTNKLQDDASDINNDVINYYNL